MDNQFLNALISAEDYRQFHDQGFLHLEQVFDDPNIEIMRSCCHRITEQGQKLNEALDTNLKDLRTERLVKGVKFVFRRESITKKFALSHVGGCATLEPKLLPLMRSTQLVRTCAALLDSQLLEHLLCQFHPKMPGSGVVFHPHRDIKHRERYALRAGSRWNDLNGKGSYVVSIIAVDPMSEKNGGLKVIKKSHLDYSNEDPLNEKLPSADELSQSPHCVALNLKAGDIAFLHPYLIHWSEDNPKDANSRYTLVSGFCCEGANPNKNPLDYAGDCTNVTLEVTAEGFKVAQR